MVKVIKSSSKSRILSAYNPQYQKCFQTASWPGIMMDLRAKGISWYLRRILNKYLENRKLLVGPNREKMMTCGVPQSSVLGPVLWNVYYDDVLNTKIPEGMHVFGYADDTAIVVTAKTEDRLVNNANTALCSISRKIRDRKLNLAREKTEALILNSGNRLKGVQVVVNGLQINSMVTLKYLGVTFDQNLRMTKHIRTCCTKSAMALTRLMPNAKGPKASARRTFASVVPSIIFYAVPIWLRALQHKKYRSMIQKVQRRMALRVCSAFKTVLNRSCTRNIELASN